MDSRTNTIYPKRGFLAEFWPLGCSNPVEPMDGYLQYRNDTIAVYSCSLGHIFLPSLERHKEVHCRNREWDQEVGNCVSIDFLGYVYYLCSHWIQRDTPYEENEFMHQPMTNDLLLKSRA